MATTTQFPNIDGEDHSGLRACQEWLTANGFSYGPLCRDQPVGVLKGDYQIAKWRNLNHYEQQLLDGEIRPMAGGWRGATGGALLILSDRVTPPAT